LMHFSLNSSIGSRMNCARSSDLKSEHVIGGPLL
jgi:hypothetical protein